MFDFHGIFSFLSDILSSQIWLEAALLTDSLLSVMKNDQHREGHTAVLARSGKVTCPVAVTERLESFSLSLCGPSSISRANAHMVHMG